MKKTVCFLLALIAVFGSLCSYSEGDVRILSASEYVVMWKSDPSRGMTYKVPTHWVESALGERYKVFTEPVPAGESCFRVCFVNKKTTTDDKSTTRMKKEFNMLIEEMKAVYEDFEWDGEISRDRQIVKFNGYASDYSYTDSNGEKMLGYVIMAKYDKRIYCMNFSGPEARFTDDMRNIMFTILESITRST